MKTNNTFQARSVKLLIWVTLFAIAMGFLETSVVVYLRELYYPDGFRFPLVVVSNKIAVVEFWREFCTIIMLVGIGIAAGRTRLERFAYFLVAFAVWDIFYYVFLEVLLGWPESLSTWDILFLIPVPWTGPVIAPCLVSLGLILLGTSIVYATDQDPKTRIRPAQWFLLLSGVGIILMSFMWDYFQLHKGSGSFIHALHSDSNMFEDIKHYVPLDFNWYLFSGGLILCGLGIWSYMASALFKTKSVTPAISETLPS